MEYIHYGDDTFRKEMYRPIKNREYRFTKPRFGFWASPVSTDYGWRDFCEREELESDLSRFFTFALSDGARVLRIREVYDLTWLPQLPGESLRGEVYLDFEMIAESFDAIEVLFGKERTVKSYALRTALNFWDCDSLLVLNPDVVICT